MQPLHDKYSLKYIASKLVMGKANGEKGTRHSYKKEDYIIRAHRKIAEPIVILLEPFTFITPNQITWLGFFFSILSSVMIVLGALDYFYLVLASFLYWLSAMMDCIDGQLARARNISSRKGEWLDVILEIGKGIFFWIAVGFNISVHTSVILGFNVWFLIAINLSFLSFLTFMSIYTSWLFHESQPVSHGHVYIVIFILLANLMELALIIFTILVVFSVIYTLFEFNFLFHPEDHKNINEE